MTETLTALHGSGRWQPARAGLIALWRYWDETFTFHNGRLLLRGPNGSGKSMALELLLPFLLDGDSSPSRLTSSGRSRGRLFDRLMTGSSEPSRTGFAWVEFRRDSDVFTVGARIRGAHATNATDVDLFTTTLVVGRDLHLLDGTRTPLSRKSLVAAIGETGRVHGSVDEHRAAVREVLFAGFSAERYASVIGALLALRKEKLSEKLDPDKLSGVLSEALPPLDDHDVAAVAEGFERLDRRRAELALLESDVAQVQQLARRQRAYARAVVLDSAATVRSAETTRDSVTRDERQARDQLEQTRRQRDEVAAEREQRETRDAQLGVEIDALKDSDAYRAGASLADLRAQAARLRQLASGAGDVAGRREQERAMAAEAAEAASDGQRVATDNARLAEVALRETASPLDGDQVATEACGLDDSDEGERLLKAWISAKGSRIGEVRVALASHENAVTRRDVHDRLVGDAEETVGRRRATLETALAAEAASRDEHADAVNTWANQCSTLGVDRLRAVLPAPAHEPATVDDAVAELRRVVAGEDGAAAQDLVQRREAAEAERSAVGAERELWASSALVDPAGPQWRSRRGLDGAPLWRLVDIAAGASAPEIDGLEAALTASGLLDAWVRPDGRVEFATGQADVLLTAVAPEAPPDGEGTLARLLAPVGSDSGGRDITGGVPVSTGARLTHSSPCIIIRS
jgi:hypothetical protein